MTLTLGVRLEANPGEKRVSIVPEVAKRCQQLGLKVIVQQGAGMQAGFLDEHYVDCETVTSEKALLQRSHILTCVQGLTPQAAKQLAANSVVIGQLAPQQSPDSIQQLAKKQVTAFAMECCPRITRAQSMDVLSSQASCAGYRAALLGAQYSTRFFPMLTTAAGTIRPAKVLVIGVGVAGLQAIATAKRLGAIVEAYDVRQATKEQAESLGARFLAISSSAEGEGGYARELNTDEKEQQQALLAKHLALADVVITTAALPGKKAPEIVSTRMIESMQAGSVIIDIAAESGGNCSLTEAGKDIVHHGVLLHGAVNLPSQLATHASEMYAKNLFSFLQLIIKDATLSLDFSDDILKAACITHQGEILAKEQQFPP